MHFLSTMEDAGPRWAEGITVKASLGGLRANVITAPTILRGNSEPEDVDILVPYGPASSNEVGEKVRAGEVRRVQIDFNDGRPKPEPVIGCFVFRLETDASGNTDWTSFPETCPAEAQDQAAPLPKSSKRSRRRLL